MPPYAHYNDRQLIQLLKQDDDAAFTELYDRYWKKLFYMGSSKLHDLPVAEELVQDIFCDLWERRATLDIRGAFSKYLSVALVYKIINVQARQKRAAHYRKYIREHDCHYSSCTEERLSFEELKHRLEKLVNDLPGKARLAFRLNKEYGLSQKEVAAQLNITEKAVERSVARAVRSLAGGLRHLFSLLF